MTERPAELISVPSLREGHREGHHSYELGTKLLDANAKLDVGGGREGDYL
jgi:hypothetical protein